MSDAASAACDDETPERGGARFMDSELVSERPLWRAVARKSATDTTFGPRLTNRVYKKNSEQL